MQAIILTWTSQLLLPSQVAAFYFFSPFRAIRHTMSTPSSSSSSQPGPSASAAATRTRMSLPSPQGRQGAGGATEAGSLSALQQPVTQAVLIRAMEQNNAEQARRLEAALSTMQTTLVGLLAPRPPSQAETDAARAQAETARAAQILEEKEQEERAAGAQAEAAREAAAQAQERLNEVAQAEEALRRARLNANLPPRQEAPDEERKLYGGEQRATSRVEAAARVLLERGELSQAEFERFKEVLGRDHQVHPPPSSPFASWAGAADHYGPGSTPTAAALLRQLQTGGLAPAAAQDREALALQRVFKALSLKEAKRSLLVKTFRDFRKYIRDYKLVTRAAYQEDPVSYWQMVWLSETVTYLYMEFGWPVALEYYTRLVEDWAKGFIDVPELVDGDAFRRGNVAGALHGPTFTMAMQMAKVEKPKSGGSSSSSGSASRQDSTDTWCDEHRLFFPEDKDHDTSKCAVRKSRLAREKKAKKAKKKKDKKDDDE